jgi:hypothetical protein
MDVATDAAGRAGCVWQLGATSVLQTLSVKLIDRPGHPPAVPVTVVAGVRGPSAFAPGLHVTDVRLAAPPESALGSDQLVTAEELAGGVRVLLDAAPAAASVDGLDVLSVTLGLPFPLSAADQKIWGPGVVGHTPLALLGGSELADVAGTPTVRWIPAKATQAMLGGLFERLRANKLGGPLPCRVVLSGRSVCAADGRVVNGLARTVIDAGGMPGLALPSTDEVLGADFELRLSVVEKLAELVVVALDGSPLATKSAADAIAQTMDRAAVTDLLPAGITVNPDPGPDLVAARRAAGRAFRGRQPNERQLTVVAEDRYTDAARRIAQDVAAASLNVDVIPAADPATEVSTRLAAGKPVDGVVTDSSRSAALIGVLPGAHDAVRL